MPERARQRTAWAGERAANAEKGADYRYRWWLDGRERSWTSVSFLIDRRGVIRHVHLGGKLAPDTDDFRVMRAKIEALLAEGA